MRRSFARLCSKIDLDGKPSTYYPRFRPRRLVMPVDPNKVHSDARSNNPLRTTYKEQQRKRRLAERHGAVKLAEVPAERTVGDMFRYMLEVCDEHRLFDSRASFSGAPWAPLEALVRETYQWEAAKRAWEVERTSTAGETTARVGRGDITTREGIGSSRGEREALSVRAVDNMWSLLDRTPLNSPVHGPLALRGKALVERAIAATAYEAFPRLRSKHLQALLHESCGLLPSSRVALRLGFAQHAGVEGDIGMWRELNVLTQRLHTARAKAAAHLERMEKGVAQQRRWYWRGVLKSALGRLTMFPVTADDLQPRLEWVRSSLFAFVGFLEMAQRSGEAGIDVETFIMKLYCSQLGHFAYRRRLMQDAEAFLEKCLQSSGAAVADGFLAEEGMKRRLRALREGLTEQLQLLRSRTPDELEVLEGKTHPLNDRADLRREQFASSGGTHAVQSLRDNMFDDYKVKRHARAAPPIVVHCLETQNALKEAQLILRYAPDVDPALRNAPIDVDQVVRKTVEVEETNSYASLRYDQQYRQVEYTVCRLFCGPYCIGEGRGETLMEAIQEAALDMTSRYYLKGAERARRVEGDSDSHPVHAAGGEAGTLRFREARTEEELAF